MADFIVIKTMSTVRGEVKKLEVFILSRQKYAAKMFTCLAQIIKKYPTRYLIKI